MGTSFPVRLFSVILLLSFLSCTEEEGFLFPPREVYTKTVEIDSLYTYIRYVYTGESRFLHTGVKDSFTTYSLIQFNVPDTLSPDSLFLNLIGDSISETLYVYKIIHSWTEGSVTYDSLDSLKGDEIIRTFVNGDSIMVQIPVSYFEILDTFGIMLFSSGFYRFFSSEGDKPPTLFVYMEDTFYTYHPYRDAYVCYHPFVGDTFKDTIILGRGVGFFTRIFLPADSIGFDNLYSRFEIGVFSPYTCTLRLYYEEYLSDEDPVSDTTTYLSLVPVFDEMRNDSCDTLKYIPVELRLKDLVRYPQYFSLPSDSLRLYLMFVEDQK